MWIIDNLCRDMSVNNKRTLNILYHIAGNNGDGIFSTLKPNEWYPESFDNQSILLEFECINEIKNLRDNLNLIIENFEKREKNESN